MADSYKTVSDPESKWARHERHLRTFLTRRHGEEIGKDPRGLVTMQFDSEKARFEAWAADSLLVAVIAASRGEQRNERTLAFRCLLQATGYCGRLGGFWPDTYMGDIVIDLRNFFEDALTDR